MLESSHAPPARWPAAALVAVAAAVAVPGPVLAEDAEELWRPTTSGPFVTISAPLAPARHLTLQPLYFAAFQRGEFDGGAREVPLEGGVESHTLLLYAEYGIDERFATGFQVAFLHNRRTLGDDSASSSGLGDWFFFARYGVPLPVGSLIPELSVTALLKAPLAQADRLAPHLLGTDEMGNGAWEALVGLDLTEYLWPVVLNLDLFFSGAFETSLDGVPTRPGLAFLWSASAELPLPLPFWPHRWALMVELSGRVQADTHVSGAAVPASGPRELTLGAGIELIFSDEVQLLVGYQRTLWGANIPALDVFGITLVPTLWTSR